MCGKWQVAERDANERASRARLLLADGMGILGTIVAAGFRFSRCLLARNIEHSMAHEEGCGFR